MFRAANNPYDDAVVKATDENLTSENWALILDVCDRVSSTPTGPSSVVGSIIKRLAHRNANVQLYTLELANALSQNCGPPLHRELASRSFTEALLRLANERNTHQMVKSKVLERMGEWTEMFKGDADLGIMEQAYEKLRAGNPGLAPPSKPIKKGMDSGDKAKEEEELQMALALSLRDNKASESSAPAGQRIGSDAAPGASEQTQQHQAQQQQQQQQPGTTAATVSRVKALYDFTPSEPGELAFRMGDIIAVLESVYKDWWKGSLRGQTGIFPLNYVEKLQDPTVEELERDAAMEGEVFSQIRNVEKLLSLLSVRQDGMGGSRGDQGTEEEITELYNQTLAIRPKLIELIGKYSQKKDDFTQLNEKFIKARRDYEALLESSMAAPQQYALPSRQRQPSQPYYANAYGPPQGAPQAYPPQRQSSYPPQQQDPRYAYQEQAPPQQQGYAYPPQNSSATPAPSQAFHFLPNGAPPPQLDRHTPKPVPSQNQMGPSGPPPESYSPQMTHSHQFPPGGARPNSIHTLNSGNPQELGSYDSPVDSRQQGQVYPPQQQQHQHLPPHLQQQPSLQSMDSPASSSVYSPQVPTPTQAPPPQDYSNYPPQQQEGYQHYAPQQQQIPLQHSGGGDGSIPQQPHQAPPAPPGQAPQQNPWAEEGRTPQPPSQPQQSVGVLPPAGTYPSLPGGGPIGAAVEGGGAPAGQGQAYQAYNPGLASQGSAPPPPHPASGPAAAGDDAADFYR